MLTLWSLQSTIWQIISVVVGVMVLSILGSAAILCLFPFTSDEEDAINHQEDEWYRAFRERHHRTEMARNLRIATPARLRTRTSRDEEAS